MNYLLKNLFKGHLKCVQQISLKEYLMFSSAEFQLFVNTKPKKEKWKFKHSAKIKQMAYLAQEGNLEIVEKITALDTPSH